MILWFVQWFFIPKFQYSTVLFLGCSFPSGCIFISAKTVPSLVCRWDVESDIFSKTRWVFHQFSWNVLSLQGGLEQPSSNNMRIIVLLIVWVFGLFMEKIQRKYKDFTGWSNESRRFTTIQCHLGVSIILMSPLCIYYHATQTDDCSFMLTVMKFDASLKTIRVCVEVNVTMFTALILIFLLLLMWVKRKLTTGFMFYFPPCTLTCHYVHLFSCSSALIFYQPITLHVGMLAWSNRVPWTV